MKGARITLSHLEIIVTNCVVSASLWFSSGFGTYWLQRWAQGSHPAWLRHCSSVTSFHLPSRPGAPWSFSKPSQLLDSIPKDRRKSICLVELGNVSCGQWHFYWTMSGKGGRTHLGFLIVCCSVSLYSPRKLTHSQVLVSWWQLTSETLFLWVTLENNGIDRLFGWIGKGEFENFLKSNTSFSDTCWMHCIRCQKE